MVIFYIHCCGPSCSYQDAKSGIRAHCDDCDTNLLKTSKIKYLLLRPLDFCYYPDHTVGSAIHNGKKGARKLQHF